MRTIGRVIVVLLIFSFSLPATAREAITIGDKLKEKSIGTDISFMEDKSGLLTFEDVRRNQSGWKASEKPSFSFGFTDSAYWFRFTVINQMNNKTWFLEIDYPPLDRIDLYRIGNGGSIAIKKAGDHFPFFYREIIDRNYIFPQKISKGRYEYYLRIKTSSSINFKPTIWSWQGLLRRFETEVPIFWLYNGIMISMAFYNFFIFFSIREKSYFYNASFISSWVFFTFALNGFAFQYLWPNSIRWANHCLPFFMCITLAFMEQFIRSSINTKKNYPKTDTFIKYCGVIPAIVWAVASLILSYALSIKIATGMVLLSVVIFYPISIVISLTGSRPAQYFVIAYTVVCIGILLYTLKTFGLLPANFITNWIIQIGAVFVVILLSLGLADNINTMKNKMELLNKGLIQSNREIRNLNDDLENRVVKRTSQLNESNLALQKSLNRLNIAKDQLVQSEKMASLGALVAGVAHEINTPLGVSIMAASLLSDKTKEVVELYHSPGEMRRSEFEKYLDVASESSGMVLSNLMRAADLVRNFKQVAVDQSVEDRRVFNVKTYADQLLFSLRPRLKKLKHKIDLNCPDDIEIESFPGVFFQIITNLVMNSLIHGFEEKEAGHITLSIWVENDILVLCYSDDGKGMDKSSLDKIFDPFFTSKRNQGGTGLGMHIVFNLVKRTLGGNLECTSSPGEGFTFICRIPIHGKSEIKTS